MKRILLAVAVCCVFSVYGIATNSDAKLERIERLEQKINLLKAERENIASKLAPMMTEMAIYTKKKLENETKIPEIPIEKGFFSASSKKELERIENDIKGFKCLLAIAKIRHDIDKINVNIDKAKIELIKAEIKAGKTPKIPLELAKALLKFTESSSKFKEAINKSYQARLKEDDVKIKYLEAFTKTQEAREKSTANDLHIKELELAELTLVETMLRFELEKAREETARAHTEEAEICVEHYYKPLAELRKIYLKFDKVVDKKNFVSFWEHD